MPAPADAVGDAEADRDPVAAALLPPLVEGGLEQQPERLGMYPAKLNDRSRLNG